MTLLDFEHHFHNYCNIICIQIVCSYKEGEQKDGYAARGGLCLSTELFRVAMSPCIGSDKPIYS